MRVYPRSLTSIYSCFWVFLAGCHSLPMTAQNDPFEDREVQAEDASRDADPIAFVHDKQRQFPEQGWWCREFDDWLTAERADAGYTIILPGINGTSRFSIGIARGLVDAGYPGALEVRDWTTGHFGLFVYHLMAIERNRELAGKIAEQIVAYQDQYPGRKVNLVGHSGGAAMAVLVLESLPADRRIDHAVLLAGAISPEHDLTDALGKTESGITNFHSWGDVPHLVVGTLALGTLDRQHTISAGAEGFRPPPNLSEEGRRLYAERLQQVPYNLDMLKSNNAGGHFGPTERKFVANWVAPVLARHE